MAVNLTPRQQQDKETLSAIRTWFKLKNYDAMRSATPGCWANELGRRLKAAWVRDSGADEVAREMISDITRHACRPDTPGNMAVVRPVTHRDLQWLALAAASSRTPAAGSPDADLAESARSEGGLDFGLLFVNLSASDADVRAAFDRWLTWRRKDRRFGVPGRITSKAMSKWATDRLLAYTDLGLWATQHTPPRRISEAMYLELLFPNDPDAGRERLRRVKRLHKKVLTREQVLTLWCAERT